MNVRTVVLAAFGISLFAPMAVAQQTDGRDCWQAFKKHQQHVQAGVCREKSHDDRGGSVSVTPDRSVKSDNNKK